MPHSQVTCNVLIGPAQQNECGAIAVADVVIFDKRMGVKAVVPMCDTCAATYDSRSAKFRVERKTASSSDRRKTR